MGNPFTSTSVTSYNANPPADDGSQVPANVVAWSTIKSKLPDPIKTAFDTSETNTNAAFAKIIGGGGFTTTAVDYTILAADQGKFVKCTASGKTITTPDATVVGSPFVVIVLNNSSGGITVAGNNPGVQQTIDGVNSFSLPAGCGVELNTDGTNWFTGGQNFNGSIVMPQGRLTITSGAPVITAEVTGATAIYYTPFAGNLCPIYNGSAFSMMSFTEQTLTLQNTSTYAASTLFDIFAFNSSGFKIGLGPAWSTSTAGSGARGTGAATTELERKNGIWTNKNSITLHNGATAYSALAANTCTYLGTLLMDGTNGQVSCHLTYGQSRTFSIWNAYNRIPIMLKAGDATASWTYGTSTYRPSNNAAANSINVVCGLAEEFISTYFNQEISNNNGNTTRIAIGINSTSAASGQGGVGVFNISTITETVVLSATYESVPQLGLNTIYALEQSSSSATFFGTEPNMVLCVKYRG